MNYFFKILDLLNRPTYLSNTLVGGIYQILSIRTPRIYLQSRLTPGFSFKENKKF